MHPQKYAIMKLTKFIFLVVGIAFFSCSPDDDNSSVEERDEAEVAQEDQAEILSYLETHSFELVNNPANSNYQNINFFEITDEDTDEIALIDSEFLKSKIVTQNEIDYTLYYLQLREGAVSEYQPTFADSVTVTFRKMLLDGTVFDESVTPRAINLPGDQEIANEVRGFALSVSEFRGASGFVENPDGTLDFSDDFGVGAVFIPSGLGYFSSIPASYNIGSYEPLLYTFQLYSGNQADHDFDGIPSAFEDLDEDQRSFDLDDDTDDDNTPNYLDPDDDGDGTLTKDEIEVNDVNGDGIITLDEITFTDSDNDGTPDYLDPDIN